MIPIYNIDNLTGGLDTMLQNVMRIGFKTSLITLTIWSIFSLIIWLFRSQEKIRKSYKIWNKEFYNNFNISSNYGTSNTYIN